MHFLDLGYYGHVVLNQRNNYLYYFSKHTELNLDALRCKYVLNLNGKSVFEENLQMHISAGKFVSLY